jgi:hypothetical protein
VPVLRRLPALPPSRLFFRRVERISQKEFVEITGITVLDKTISGVEYTMRWVPTAIGKKLGVAPSEPSKEKMMFQLFDDGWRIVH